MDYNTLISSINDMSCLVVGDIMLDRFLYGCVDRISPEAPIPVVHITQRKETLGGAGNVAANIRNYGAKTVLCGVLGEDESASRIFKLLDVSGIKFTGIHSNKHITTTKTRVIGMKQQIIRFDEEAIFKPSDADSEKIISKKLIQNISAIVLSDYNKGFCTAELCRSLINEAMTRSIPVIVDPKDHNWEKYKNVYLITPNLKEFCMAAGNPNTEDKALISEARKLSRQYEIENILITLSEQGMLLITPSNEYYLPTKAREVADVSGAGDTVTATLAVFLAAGLQIDQAITYANTAAGLVVERLGTASVTLSDLCNAVYADTRYGRSESKIVNSRELKRRINIWRKNDKKIVFTNGCFDIVHPGHINYLEQARQLGDVLIIGLNSDGSVRRLKGKTRPINNQLYRSQIIAALQAVDAVILFDELTPESLVEAVQPDILVKGGDYKPEDVLGSEFAGRTVILPFIQGYSTTGVIEKCQVAMS